MTRQPVHASLSPVRPVRRRLRDDRGSVAVELAIGMPLAVLFVFLIVGAYHLGQANIDVNAAAAAASRAASLTRSAGAADAAARDSATANLAGQCATVTVSVDTSEFHRGGAVTVHVGCTVTTEGLLGVGLPGSMTVSASSTSPLDLYRARALGFGITEAPSAANPRMGGA
ncbi:TadE/TadG family type IV pilus assembly protein [Dactylosporangium sp. CA-092794]|uniref:TadE/TadG family type IV pilus assembly protein n=1 Tax=Dactylosporangium sp. CA-092794 TaxID=3239929 RepID=UPI003D8EB8D9